MHVVFHKHMATSPRDDSADAHSMMMSVNAHNMSSRVFMRYMTLWGFIDLRTSLQISLTRGSRGVRAPWGFTLARVGRL